MAASCRPLARSRGGGGGLLPCPRAAAARLRSAWWRGGRAWRAGWVVLGQGSDVGGGARAFVPASGWLRCGGGRRRFLPSVFACVVRAAAGEGEGERLWLRGRLPLPPTCPPSLSRCRALASLASYSV
jgi:hypothetical protein